MTFILSNLSKDGYQPNGCHHPDRGTTLRWQQTTGCLYQKMESQHMIPLRLPMHINPMLSHAVVFQLTFSQILLFFKAVLLFSLFPFKESGSLTDTGDSEILIKYAWIQRRENHNPTLEPEACQGVTSYFLPWTAHGHFLRTLEQTWPEFIILASI